MGDESLRLYIGGEERGTARPLYAMSVEKENKRTVVVSSNSFSEYLLDLQQYLNQIRNDGDSLIKRLVPDFKDWKFEAKRYGKEREIIRNEFSLYNRILNIS